MSEPFVAEITMFGFNFAPKGWAFCNGQLMPISQNTALFALLGTMYGGDGKSTFALPNLQGSTANCMGQGSGLSNYDQGQVGGSPTVTLIQSEMPAHSHFFNANANVGTGVNAAQNQLGVGQGGTKQNSFNAKIYSTNPGQATAALSPAAIGIAGQSQPHSNMQPYLTLNFCIALAGVFPARN
jgi:microcystin-dependent protein